MINTYGLELNPPAEENRVRKAEIELGVKFPSDYIEFISFSNGAEGSIGENYLILWSIDEIIELNEAYGVNDFAKGIICIHFAYLPIIFILSVYNSGVPESEENLV